MSIQHSEFQRIMFAELERIGLRLEDLPGLAFTREDAEAEFLTLLKPLPKGSTWRDVFPDIPENWTSGTPWWPIHYRPYGPFDYQELPTGPAVHVVLSGPAEPGQLADFIAAALKAGWPVYGGGFLEGSTNHAHVVLERGTSEETLAEFVNWIEARSEVELATISPRPETDYDR